MRITIAQLNPRVGDVDGNLELLKDALAKAENQSSDLVVFPELFLIGYPPRDLLEKSRIINKTHDAVEQVCTLSRNCPHMGIIIGTPLRNTSGTGRALHNCALLIMDGKILFQQNKSLLPSYDVFDEERYFEAAEKTDIIEFKNHKLGLSVCEDAWSDPRFWFRETKPYSMDPIAELAKKGADLMINISASPFHLDKEKTRHALIAGHARKHSVPFVYVNQTGGNDEILFDGGSMACDSEGMLICSAGFFKEAVVTFDTGDKGRPKQDMLPKNRIAMAHEALVMGLGDYMRKCGFKKTVIGLSGGIDSAVTCALAVAALGRENVKGISMPSMYSSTGSVEDSRKLADNLGIEFSVVAIKDIVDAYGAALKDEFAGTQENIAEENIQARVRGNILMAISNKSGALVLTTGNKSELSVGYCTLYGDMSGGLAVISDVPKTMVYDIARYINRDREIIPSDTITKPPSAELRPDQKDEDSLPPYPVLDAILNGYIEEDKSLEKLVAEGFDPKTVEWVIRTVNRNEYKRRQAAPGLKITSKAFGSGRRMPIAAHYVI